MALPFKRFPIVAAMPLLFFLPVLAAASPTSHELIVQGAADLRAERYEEALKRFEAATLADPNDAEAFFFQGAALDRLGRFQDALSGLEKANAMGFKGPALAFDTGWALLRLARWSDAIVQLEYFEKAVPGRGKTSEFIGRAYFGLGQYDKAEAKLKEAIQRDPALKPTALLFLAAIEQERKNPAAAKVYLETLLREAPESAIAQTLKKEM